MKTPDLFSSAPKSAQKLAEDAKKAKRLKERKEFMKRLQDGLSKR